jgi:Protein of unknown function (DUF3522)
MLSSISNEKLFLLIGNFFYLIPASYLLNRFFRLKESYAAIHCLLCVSVCLISFFYHWCDIPLPFNMSEDDLPPFYHCIIPFSGLYFLDFQLSSMTAVNLFSYQLMPFDSVLREMTLIFMFIFNTFFFYASDNFTSVTYYISAIFSCLLIGLLRLYRRKQHPFLSTKRKSSTWKTPKWYFPVEGNNFFLCVFIILFIVAFVCFGTEENNVDHYMLLHGFWHVTSAWGLLFGFLWIDSLSFSAPKKQKERFYRRWIDKINYYRFKKRKQPLHLIIEVEVQQQQQEKQEEYPKTIEIC